MKDKIDYSLYLVTDKKILKGGDFLESIKQAILGGVTIIQLREKDLYSLDFYKQSKELKELADKYSVPLIINDRLDIAMLCDASGVHLGQKDIPCKEARKIFGKDKIIGVSCANLLEAIKAEKDGADYIGVGAMFLTNTKGDTRPVSIETLKIIKNSVKIPVVAIGGINEDNINKIVTTRVDGVAVVSAILGKEDIKQAAQRFSSII
ncbi:MAG: thiamine phosphate synthase [Clostridiaceae bacterium]